MRRILLASALGSTVLLCVGIWAEARQQGGSGTAPPLAPGGAAPQGRPAIDPALQVTPQCGPWMVLAATYQGADALEMATTMAWHIRRKHNLPAYVFNYSDAKRRRENDEELAKAQSNPNYHPRFTRVEENCGVLIGGCADNDHAGALLKKVRTLEFPEVRLPDGRPCYGMRFAFGSSNNPDKPVTVKDNPFLTAIVCRNPTVAAAPRPKTDPAWAALNSEEEYSVFKCPKPWTLVVKQYAGVGITQDISENDGNILGKLWPNKHQGESLNAAGFNAHEMAKALRKLGFDAYVLHTRTNSIVTVGGFSAQNDPEMARIKQRLDGLRPSQPGYPDQLGLFYYPVPMEVPR
jgi:hypothetical protein